MLSPSTEDMRSIPDFHLKGVPKRFHGDWMKYASSQSEEKGDKREDKDECSHAGVDARDGFDFEVWRRMYDNVSVAATSIQSSAVQTTE